MAIETASSNSAQKSFANESIRDSKELLLTDTTMRDAHQSLLATRLRTIDMLHIADAYARLAPILSRWKCGAGRRSIPQCDSFRESPWQRLSELRTRIPNILFQMLLRLERGWLHELSRQRCPRVRQGSSRRRCRYFPVFDALNWSENMRVAMEAVVEKSGMICEAGSATPETFSIPIGQNIH